MSPPTRAKGRLWRLALTLWVLGVVALATLLPVSQLSLKSPAPFACLVFCGNESARDLISNILLFIPVGWVARYWLRPRGALLFCLLATILIETLQATVIQGRESSLRDILTNVAGGAIGIGLFTAWSRLIWSDPTRSRRLAGLATAAWLLVLVITAKGLEPDRPAEPWYGHWRADLENYARYEGRLLQVELSGSIPSNGPMPEPTPLRIALARDSFTIRITAVSGPAPRMAAPMFIVSDQQYHEILFVGQSLQSLRLHLRTRFDGWEMRGILAKLPFFPGRAEGDTVLITAGLHDRAWVLAATSKGIHEEMRLPLSVGLGWTAVLPIRLPIWNEWVLLNGLWLAALIFPAGYWLGRASPAGGAVIGLLLVGTGLGLLPGGLAAAPSVGSDWFGAFGGMAFGWLVGVCLRRRLGTGETGQ